MEGRVDPVSEAFARIIDEIYWEEDLAVAERRLAKFLESIDDDLRELLLERRRKICSDPSVIIEAVRLETMATEAGLESPAARLLFAKSLLNTGFLIQCTPTWGRLTPREKARILVAMYRASKALELAAKRFPDVDELHLSHAEEMIELAARRAEEYGLIQELREHIARLADRLSRREEGRRRNRRR